MAVKTTNKTTTKTKNTKMTPYEKEVYDAVVKINEYRLAAEANVVSILYKQPELIKENNLDVENFRNNTWRVFFSIADGVYNVEHKNVIDDITVSFYLEKHPNLREKYDEYGGWETINSATGYVKVDNFEGYLQDLQKAEALTKLVKLGFPVQERLADFWDMSAEEIYNEYEVLLNNTFVNIEGKIQSFNGFDGMRELVDELDAGAGVGIPLLDFEYLNKEIGGFQGGNVYGLGLSTGNGKSTLSIAMLLKVMVEKNLRTVFIINEEDERKFKKEALIWYASTIAKKPIPKHVLRDGKYSKEVKEVLYEAADWFEKMKERKNITIIPLETYTSATTCKLLKQYCGLNADVIVVDTLKASADSRGEQQWISLMSDSVDYYNIIKKSNTALLITFQLTKNRSRYLSVADINASKGITDIMSVVILARPPLQDEFEGEKHELYCYKVQGHGSKIPFKLKNDGTHYMIYGIVKNRFGMSDIQIVGEANYSINQYKDLGYCVVQNTDY